LILVSGALIGYSWIEVEKKSVRDRLLHLTLALAFALIFGGAAGAAYFYRDSLFEWNWVRSAGSFTEKENPGLRKAALLYLEERLSKPGEVCVDQWIGMDERYLYMAVGCAYFEEKMGQVEAIGDANYLATRFRYRRDEIEHLEQPDLREFRNSLRRLFPRQAAHLLMVKMNPDHYRKAGLAKIQARSSF
jgi:hypothetical protein